MAIEQKEGLTQSDVIEVTKKIEKQMLIIQKLNPSEFNIKAVELLKECLYTMETSILASSIQTPTESASLTASYKNQLNLFTSHANSTAKEEEIESTSNLNARI